jgi:hypothetical protein
MGGDAELGRFRVLHPPKGHAIAVEDHAARKIPLNPEASRPKPRSIDTARDAVTPERSATHIREGLT